MFKNKITKICGGVIALVLILALGLWGCSDLGASKKEKETDVVIEPDTDPIPETEEETGPIATHENCFGYDENDSTRITQFWVEDSACSRDIVLPDSIRIIGASAFYNRYVTSIILNEGLEVIEAFAFRRNLLTEIDIPDSVYLIENDAFLSNEDLLQVNIGLGSIEIWHNAFGIHLYNICIEALEEEVTAYEDFTLDYDVTYGGECL